MMVATDTCPDCGLSLLFGEHPPWRCGLHPVHAAVSYVVRAVWAVDGQEVENTSTVAADRLYAHLAALVDQAPIIELHVTGIQNRHLRPQPAPLLDPQGADHE